MSKKSNKAVVALDFIPKAKKKRSKNPSSRYSCQVSESGKVVAFRQGAYKGPLPTITVEANPKDLAAAYQRWEGRRKNPGGRYENPFDPGTLAAIGAAAGGALGSMGAAWVTAIVAAIGALVGYNWRKITAGVKTGARKARSTPRTNPQPSESELIRRLKF